MIAHGEDLRAEVGEAANAIIEDWRTARLSPPDRALCEFAEKLTASPARMGAGDVEALRAAGFSDVAIHDATQVVSYFNYINRIADALGTDLEEGMPPRPRSWHPEPRPLPELSRSAVVTLEEITTSSLSTMLRMAVTPYQQRFVASNAVSLAQAGFYPQMTPRAIAADGAPVGFVMWEQQDNALYVIRFLIDARVQAMGFGARALQLVIDHARTLPGIRRVTLTYVPAPGSPEPFYRRFGFVPTGEADEGELEMELVL
jgi:diamine N-acetyltransferase